MNLEIEEIDYFVFTNKAVNNIYNPQNEKINILFKNNKIIDIAYASDQLDINVLSKTVTKYFLCYPKNI
jgi:hypothetical protein